MSDPLLRRSPLSQFLAEARGWPSSKEIGVSLKERPFWGHLNLRGKPDDQLFLGTVQQRLGVFLPLEPNTVTENETVTALWLGPDEWLLITPPSREGELARALRDALQGTFFGLTDVTDGQTIFCISGARAIDALSKGCSLDLQPDVFATGCCAQTLVAKVGVLIRYVHHSPCFELIVRRSFAEYFALWLKDAATEYGFGVI